MPTKPPSHRPPRADLPDGRPSAHARGYGRRWQALRLEYLSRHPMCPCGEAALHVDHVLAREKGGSDDEANLQALCASCHSRKTVERDGGLGRPRH